MDANSQHGDSRGHADVKHRVGGTAFMLVALALAAAGCSQGSSKSIAPSAVPAQAEALLPPANPKCVASGVMTVELQRAAEEVSLATEAGNTLAQGMSDQSLDAEGLAAGRNEIYAHQTAASAHVRTAAEAISPEYPEVADLLLVAAKQYQQAANAFSNLEGRAFTEHSKLAATTVSKAKEALIKAGVPEC